jgi:hypothetical protein
MATIVRKRSYRATTRLAMSEEGDYKLLTVRDGIRPVCEHQYENRKEAGVNVIMFPSTFCLRGWPLA